MLACIGLVIGFGSSSNLPAAYGIAVTLTMIITTILFYSAVRKLWGWNVWAQRLFAPRFLPSNWPSSALMPLQLEPLRKNFTRITGYYRFMETPNLPELRERARERKLQFDASRITFFLSKETIIGSGKSGMSVWRQKLFAFMSRNATSAANYFQLPPNRVVELGMQMEL